MKILIFSKDLNTLFLIDIISQFLNKCEKMRIRQRIAYIYSLIRKIGFSNSLNYLIQRKLKPRNTFVKVRVPGLKHLVYLRNKTYDIHIFYQIFIKEDLKFDYGDSISTILDCGANIGLATLYYVRKFPEAKIISIEPEKHNYNLLVKNTNGYSNVSAVETGIYGEDCELLIVDEYGEEASYRTIPFTERGKVLQSISCRSIKSIIAEFSLVKIDILKMDIEGSEKNCLLSSEIDWLKKTRYFLLEIHEAIHPGLKKEIIEVVPDNFEIFNNGEYTIFINTFN